MPKRYSMQFRNDASWDSYIEQLHNFGIDRAIEIKQAAYDRYMAK